MIRVPAEAGKNTRNVAEDNKFYRALTGFNRYRVTTRVSMYFEHNMKIDSAFVNEELGDELLRDIARDGVIIYGKIGN